MVKVLLGMEPVLNVLKCYLKWGQFFRGVTWLGASILTVKALLDMEPIVIVLSVTKNGASFFKDATWHGASFKLLRCYLTWSQFLIFKVLLKMEPVLHC